VNVIELAGAGKRYNIYDRPRDRLRELASLYRRSYHREHWALRDLSLEIRKGETFCLIGENGSGKSTLLAMIAGILQPTVGTANIRGRVTALLELGSGFNPEFSGRQNVYLNGTILGLSTGQISERMDQILEFAEIGTFIDQPVKTYSSGMVMRLGFSLAVHMDPEILLVDEALAVGDVYFRQRCMRRIHEMRASGVTIVYASHDIADVKALGHRVLWLDRGRMAALGDPAEVAMRYLAALLKKDSQYVRQAREAAANEANAGSAGSAESPDLARGEIRSGELGRPLAGKHRHGSGRGEVVGISLHDARGGPIENFQSPAQVVVRITVRAVEAIGRPIVGMQLRDLRGVELAGTNTAREEISLPAMRPGESYTVDFRLRIPELQPACYTFTPAIADGSPEEFELCDMVEDALRVRIDGAGQPVYGYLAIPCRGVTFSGS
jgi:lipopolysaccharide transport system ATP-binding protein